MFWLSSEKKSAKFDNYFDYGNDKMKMSQTIGIENKKAIPKKLLRNILTFSFSIP